MAESARWVQVMPDGTLRSLRGKRARSVFLANRKAARARNQSKRTAMFANAAAPVPLSSEFPHVWHGIKGRKGLRACSLWVLETKRCPVCHAPRWQRYAYRDYLAIRRPGGWLVRSRALPQWKCPATRPPTPAPLRCNCFRPGPPKPTL